MPAAANAGGIEGGCGGLDLHASQGEIGESKNRMGENVPTNNTLDGFRISVYICVIKTLEDFLAQPRKSLNKGSLRSQSFTRKTMR